nr:hypothetical protein [Tanacetum cinerariifolium]
MHAPPRLGHQGIDLTKIICYKTKLENTCNNETNLSETQLEHEKEDELVMVVVKVVHECRHWIGNRGESFWEEGADFRVDVLRFHTCLTDILSFLEKFGWWFEQDIGGKSEDDSEKRLVMNTCNNEKNLSETQLKHEKEDELVMVVVKVVHECRHWIVDCMMVVKEIKDELLEETEKFGWWFEQDIGGKSEDDSEKRLVMVSEEGWMS